MEGHWKFPVVGGGGGGGERGREEGLKSQSFQRKVHVHDCMKPNWNFQRGWGLNQITFHGGAGGMDISKTTQHKGTHLIP